MIKHIFRTTLLVLFAFTLNTIDPPTAYAESFFSKTKSKFESILKKRKKKEEAPKPVKYLATTPTDLPKHWILQKHIDPILGGEILTAEVGDKSKPVIMLVHGLGQLGMRDWLNVVPALEKDYFVVLLDLPGFSSSGKPPGKYSPSNYALVLSHLKAHYSPKDKIIVVGHSMGGAVTLRYSHLYPADVAKIILVDAAGILEQTAFMKHSSDFSQPHSTANKPADGLLNDAQDISGNLVEIINRVPKPTMISNNDTIWSKLFSNMPNINAAYALIEENFTTAIFSNNTPVGLIWGKLDRVAPLRTGKILERNLKNSRMHVISEAGHVPMKSHPDEFNQLLTNLLIEKNIESETTETPPSKDRTLHCKDDKNRVFTGYYSTIIIENCTDTLLVDIDANNIKIIDSRIELENVSITSNDTAMHITDSVVLATNVHIDAPIGIKLDDSRLDLAGSVIQAKYSAIFVEKKSRLLFSVSLLKDLQMSGTAHGIYTEKDAHFRRITPYTF